MSNTHEVPLVRKAIAAAALANITCSSHPNPIVLEEAQESQWTPAALERAGSTLKALNRIAKRPPVHILFEDVSYTVSSHKGEKKVLHNISGEFRSGELSCILGPSGSGKTTLLNILAGYKTNGVTGSILVNGHSRDLRLFRKLSTYIMQDDLLQPRLTVLESIRIAANLKLGKNLDNAEKELIVEEILKTLGLWNSRNTMTECLSGGQLKRLSIGLELVNNPPVIFLDEPTTGLDIVSIRQLVVLLRLLSRQGRTIICIIHQPSASLFALFDRAFILARGLCCYQGVPQLLVSYMSEVGHLCPTTNNPADFVIETLAMNVESIAQLSEHCQNGKLCRKPDRMISRGGKKPKLHSDESIQRMYVEHVTKENMTKMEFPNSFWVQFLIISKRMFIQAGRNKTSLWIQFGHHISTSLLLGCIFYNVGNNAALSVVNFKFCLSLVVFFMYTYSMTPVLLFPQQVHLLRREYFNHWYSLKAYYTALTISNIPLMIIFGGLAIVIAYVISGQLLELKRFILFTIIGLLIGLCSDAFGLAIGSIMKTTNGSIVGPASLAPLLVLACYGLGFGPYIEEFMKVLMRLSYLRYGVTGFAIALYEDRDYIECPDDLCLYSDPKLIIRDLGMETDKYHIQILALLGFTVLHKILGYLFLKYRLTTEFSNRFMSYLSKVLKHR